MSNDNEGIDDIRRAHMERIDDRLRALELQQQGAAARLETEVGNLSRVMMEIRDIIKRHDTIFFGSNGNVGLVTRLDRLEQSEKTRDWIGRIAVSTSVVLILKILWDVILTHNH